MDITNNLKSVLIIDDKECEVEKLEEILDLEGIYYTYSSPTELEKFDKKTKNHQIIFMDFSLDDSKNEMENISLIRRVLKKICHSDFGSYGLILWTKHIEHIELFKEKLSKDAKSRQYATPLFIIGLNKLNYIQKNNYENVWADLKKELNKDKAATFFFNWRNSIEYGADKTLNNIYKLVPEYNMQNIQFPYMLFQMAKSYSGVPTKEMEVYKGMDKDAYRVFDELLYSDLISQQCQYEDFFPEQMEKPNYAFQEELEHISKINSKLLIDFSITEQATVMPGNVYQVLNNNSFLKLNSHPNKYNSIQIAIEMTPPCDFSNKKVSSRLIGGFMIDCPTDEKKLFKYINQTFKADSKYLIWPFYYDNSIKFICFDFRNIYIDDDSKLKDTLSYKLLFMVKHRLFADILQKFSSHAARLGLSIVQPELNK